MAGGIDLTLAQAGTAYFVRSGLGMASALPKLLVQTGTIGAM
jgi:hypothetical protein